MMLLIIIGSLMAYFFIGINIARSKYAIEMVSYDFMDQRTLTAKIAEKQSTLNTMAHASYCYLKYSSLKKDGCTCNSKGKWLRTNADIINLKSGVVPEPGIPIFTIGLWPLTLIGDYIKGGKVKGYHPALTAKLERELEIESR